MINSLRLLSYLSVCLLVACNDLIDVTPYDTLPVNARRDLNAENIQLWQQRSAHGTGALTIALTSDPHFYYGALTDMIDHMNSQHGVDVVMVNGDLTDQGLKAEFELFADRMERSIHPWIAVIGNHDHLSNGRIIYEQIFGARNFHVDMRGYRFIFFDNTVWEAAEPPDLGWLEQTLAGAGGDIPIVIAHIPVHTDQLEVEYGPEIREMFNQYDVPLFIHGHVHGFKDGMPFDDGVRYLSIPWPRSREYVLLTMEGMEFTVERVAI